MVYMSKHYKELSRHVLEAKKRGLLVGKGINGGGWCNLAIALGFDGYPTKAQAKAFVRQTTGAHIIFKPVEKPAPRKFVAPRFEQTDEFLFSYEWRRVRMVALKKHGARCQCCGASPHDGATMNVDHIKPRKLFPDLALDVENLQVLCHDCNHGKGNWDMTDWRPNGEKTAIEELKEIAKIG